MIETIKQMQTSTHTRLDYSTHLVHCFRKEITVYLLMNYTEEKAKQAIHSIKYQV